MTTETQTKRTRSPRRHADLELFALAACCRVLGPLSPDAQSRVISCLHANYVLHDITSATTTKPGNGDGDQP